MLERMNISELKSLKRKLREVVRQLPAEKAYTMLVFLEDRICAEIALKDKQ